MTYLTPTMVSAIERILTHAADNDGALSIGVSNKRGEDKVLVGYHFGHETGPDGEDTGMVGGAAYGMGTTLEEAMATVLGDLGLSVPEPDNRPHSRACGIFCRGHGTACSKNCPTCGGMDLRTR